MKTANLPYEVHHGDNVKRFRTMQRIKQNEFADRLAKLTNGKFNQSEVSALEAKEEIDDNMLRLIAEAIGYPVEIFKAFPKDVDSGLINVFLQAITNNSGAAIGCHKVDIHNTPNSPEMVEKMDELYKEVIKSKDAEIAILKQWVEEKKK